MTYEEFEIALSKSRLTRYLNACSNHKSKALQLYRLNVGLSQQFHAILGIFEVVFRNAIDRHYSAYFEDAEWLKRQIAPRGFLSSPVLSTGRRRHRSKKVIEKAIRNLGSLYSHDKLVAALTFGFWVNLFATLEFRFGGQTLHHIFTNRPKGTTPKHLFKCLMILLSFRNRIAHHEQICFNAQHKKDLTIAQQHYDLLLQLTTWLGYHPSKLFSGLDETQSKITTLTTL